MRQRRQGFTLMEVLIVIGIISVLAAIIFPVLAGVRRDARRTVSASNLRQCGMALLMYCNDNDGYEAMPSGEVARRLLKNMPTCDPSDTWRKGCSEDFGDPLIGSYAYINAFSDFSHDHWVSTLQSKKNPTLLAAIYYADPVPIPFHGIQATPSAACGIHEEKCLLPDRVLRFRLDGSVTLTKDTNPGRLFFHWGVVFSDDGDGIEWVAVPRQPKP